MLTIFAWNIDRLNRKIDETVSAILNADATTVVLTEYQEKYHSAIVEGLSNKYPYVEYFDPTPRKNGILMVSKKVLERGKEVGPPEAPASLGQVFLPKFDVFLFGLRLLSGQSERAHLGNQMKTFKAAVFDKYNTSKAIVVGDFNISLERKGGSSSHQEGQKTLNEILSGGWKVAKSPNPKSKSFFSKSGSNSSVIDYCLVSAPLGDCIAGYDYITKLDRYSLAGEKGSLSDHAAQLIRLSDTEVANEI